MRKFLLSVSVFLLALLNANADVAPQKYYVQFTDKNGTPYSINDPGAFLTQRAIQRRINQGIAILEEDLPVNPAYITAVQNLGVSVLTVSKWMNGITIYAPDPSVLTLIADLPFVQQIVKDRQITGTANRAFRDKFTTESASFLPVNRTGTSTASASSLFDYGPSWTQIHMLNGDVLHNLGFRGEGKVIAILDAGFENADVIPAFDSLWQNGQILGNKDFVGPGNNIFTAHFHGTCVLSTMGGNLPGQIVGTAPKASFWLLRTEDASTEYLIEEYNWVAGAEFADSVGADVINSSLGYSTFDDSTMDHTWADITGNTTVVTRGANTAASKGIAIVNSAGNLADYPWHYESFPSDGLQVLCIAAVDSARQHASFSSIGYPSATDPKPDVAAMGVQDVIAFPDGSVGTGSGTSFSSPVTAGLVACLWEAYPSADRQMICQAVQESASLYPGHDTLIGYGIPDFSKAMTFLSLPITESCKSRVFPDPFQDYISVDYFSAISQKIDITLYDMTGRVVYHQANASCFAGENRINLTGLGGLMKGCYILHVSGEGCSETHRVIKVL
jgi:serine protease AprX